MCVRIYQEMKEQQLFSLPSKWDNKSVEDPMQATFTMEMTLHWLFLLYNNVVKSYNKHKGCHASTGIETNPLTLSSKSSSRFCASFFCDSSWFRVAVSESNSFCKTWTSLCLILMSASCWALSLSKCSFSLRKIPSWE